jgi:hypothetical protein
MADSMQRTSPKHILTGIFRKAALTILVLIITSAFIEIGLRIFDPIGIEYFFEAAKYFKSMQPDERYAYIHTAGYREVLQDVEVSINSHGFRGPEFERIKPAGKKRVMILGDSVVFGWGARQDDIFGLQLQKIFDEERGDVEVIPAGVGSWNTRTEYEYLRSDGADYEPDVLVLIIVPNDVKPNDGGITQVARERLSAGSQRRGVVKRSLDKLWRGAVHHSYFMMHIQYLLKTRKDRETNERPAADSPQWEDARLAVDGITEFCRENDVVFVPYLYGSSAVIESKPALQLYRTHLESRGIRAYTMPDSLFAAKFRNSIVDGHPNSAGHAIISRVIYREISPLFAD